MKACEPFLFFYLKYVVKLFVLTLHLHSKPEIIQTMLYKILCTLQLTPKQNIK